MNVFDCITSRRSVRSFEKKPVDDKLIGVMLYMATHAPSAGNTQDWHFIVVKDETQRKKLADASLNQNFIAKAPVIFVVCIDLEKANLRYGKRGESMYSSQHSGAVTMILTLTAKALGLDSCWVGAFDEEKVSHIMELPDTLRPVVILPVGYGAEKPEKPRRIPFENVTSVDRFGKKFSLSAIQPHAKLGEELMEPLSVYLEETFNKIKKIEMPKKEGKLSFQEFLRKLAGQH